jgi:LmbE family N-acetylglucosaminyl deacetylase
LHLVFIGAHPDDEASAGGTIAKYVDHGHEATIVVATRGGRGHWKMPSDELERVRTGEMKGAAEILGAEVVFLDYEDADVPAGDAMKEELVDVVRELKPDIVITFHPLVWRDDHRRVGLAAADACFKACLPLVETEHPAHRPIPDIYFIGAPMLPVEPDVYIDITDYMDVKIESLKRHASQWVRWEIDEDDSTVPLEDVIDRVRHRARQLGVESGVRYAEAFISQHPRRRALDLFPARG